MHGQRRGLEVLDDGGKRGQIGIDAQRTDHGQHGQCNGDTGVLQHKSGMRRDLQGMDASVRLRQVSRQATCGAPLGSGYRPPEHLAPARAAGG